MEGGGGREHGKLSPEQELKEGTCVTRSKCGRAVGGVAIKSLARRSPPPERLDCPRRVPGASRTRGGGEGWGRLAKPSVAAGATRKGQNDKGESGFAVLKPPEVCTHGWRRMRGANSEAGGTPRAPPSRAGEVCLPQGLSRPKPGLAGRCTVQHSTHRDTVPSNPQWTGVCEPDGRSDYSPPAAQRRQIFTEQVTESAHQPWAEAPGSVTEPALRGTREPDLQV